ncbi:2-isopropylmalate synthase, partial [Halorubrum sp. Atlit-9R]
SDAEVREVTRRVKDHGAEKERIDDSTPEVFARDVGVPHENEREEEVRA